MRQRHGADPSPLLPLLQSLLALLLLLLTAAAEQVRELEVSEGAGPGTRVGYIGDSPPFLIVPVPGSAVDSDLSIDSNTGEIRTKVKLDRETRSSYSLVALPRSGENIRVVVRVLDENDNAPSFPSNFMEIEFPENTPRDTKRTLNPARDLDLDIFNTQRYNIVSGNLNNAFRLSSHRERDGVLYLDLQINGVLDRETTPQYSLVIEALDGGNPPLRGSMTVNITIQDVNDNQPIFNQSRYFATIPENATVGTSVLQVFASDADAGENGQVEYSINRRQSDRDAMFRIDSKTGLIAVNRPLDYETKEVHELVVTAKDRGGQPLETTAFVSISVTDVNDNQPTIDVIFLSDDATPKISETAQKGEFVARISVNDPDSKTEYSNVNVTLEGGEGHFGLTTQDSIIYLVIVAMPIDREQTANYTLSVIATDMGDPPLHASRTFHLRVTDVNDNPPEFLESVYHANVLEVAEPGTSVIQVTAYDKDEGENSQLTYNLLETHPGHPSWFQIDSKTGLISTKSQIDCETDPVPKVLVVATDRGSPPLSSTATVLVTIHDVNDNEPIFDQSYYNATIPENTPKGTCILKVSATDPDCGVNALVNYTLGGSGEGGGGPSEFSLRSDTGELCLSDSVDFERKHNFEFPIIATDRGGLSTRANVKIQLTDVNDNPPIFYPLEYNVTLSDSGPPGPVLSLAATDPDSGLFGKITYRIVSGNGEGLFRLESGSGELSLSRPVGSGLGKRSYHLTVSATDGGGLSARRPAEVTIRIDDSRSGSGTPTFVRSRYTLSVREDALPNTIVGSVKATIQGRDGRVRYSIVSGDPDGFFSLDPDSGTLRTVSPLDRETKASFLLGLQAVGPTSSIPGNAQVHVTIEDVNDNPPVFDSDSVRISVRESETGSSPLYTAHATDRDSGQFGTITYRLEGGPRGLFRLDSSTGALSLSGRLDFESVQRHSLLIRASDGGQPPLSANLTVLVEVQDVNDNPPVFERPEYSTSVSEALPVQSQILQVTAVDLDTGNNARLSYRLLEPPVVEFGISSTSGWIYLAAPLDRELRDTYSLRVIAADNGSPPATATALVTVHVTDANDNDPVFLDDRYSWTIEENLPRGSIVGKLSAVDLDLGVNSALSYSLIPPNSSFQVDPNTGIVTTTEILDREIRASYELVAEARDGGTPPRTARVPARISVLDVNDNPPEIVDPREDVVSIREEQPPGTEVVRVRAVDRDSGPNATLTYSILKGRDADGWRVFSIDPVSGTLRTRVPLEAGEREVYRVRVAATDTGSPPRQSVRTLSVEVLALYDHRPTFSSSSLTFKVREDASPGFVVGSVVGPEAGGQAAGSGRARAGHLMYSLSSSEPDPAFDLDRGTGSLVVTRPLDRESLSEYRLEVRALDTSTTINHQSSAVVVKVEVIDVNDNPPRWNDELLELELKEDLLVGSVVHTFRATDEDSSPNCDLRYSLVKSHPSDLFNVDSLTGTLSLMKPLDYEEIKIITLVVKATDQAVNISERLSSTITARITVKDVNDNRPVFVAPLSKTVFAKDGAGLGEVVCQVMAVDGDSGDFGRVSYILTSGNEDGRFNLNFETGLLTVARPLDPGGRYTLNVTASDQDSPPLQTTLQLTISVRGVTDSPPAFTSRQYWANVSEDATLGAYITRIQARIQASNGGDVSLRYSSSSELFRVDPLSGVVTLGGPLDRERLSSYEVSLYATGEEPALSYDTTSLTVTVTDANDHSPHFPACYPLAVPENSPLSVIHRFQAYDPDSGPNGDITYSITGGNVGNKFSLDPVTGELSARPLDREATASYRLTITATDSGSPSLASSCNLTVRVLDENDNPPVFGGLGAGSAGGGSVRIRARVREDAPLGSPVLNLTASDPDLGENARLTFSLANESVALFRIDPDTGVIYTAGLFDRERQSVYHFQVVARDNGPYDARSESTTVEVRVEDVNDNKPVFSTYPFSARIPAHVAPGKELLRLTATDADAGANAEIVYSLVGGGGENGGKFRLEPKSGVLTATSSLGSEPALYRLEVLATDRGNPAQSSSGLVELRVGGGWDGSAPESNPTLRFQNSSYTAYIQENPLLGTEIIQVSAVRSDGRRQKINYRLVSGNEGDRFEINPTTGMIRVALSSGLDFEAESKIRLTVEASADSGVPSGRLYGYATVWVHLSDQNDNPPQFTQSVYSTTVWEGNNKGTFVMQVSATDLDTGPNSQLLYHIVDGNHDNAFIIQPPSSGIVKMNIVLDREIRDSYRLKVIATDEGVPQLTGTSTILVNIVDINDNQPTFPPPSLITVNEGKEVGSVLTAVTANDVDSNPPLTYTLSDPDEKGFSIDRFSGKVTLTHRLDYETRKEYQLGITASDSAHTATTILTVLVADDNDNPPVFARSNYQAVLSSDSGEKMTPLVTVSASDADSDKNNKISYSLVRAEPGFLIDDKKGVILANRSAIIGSSISSPSGLKVIDLTVLATDSGKPPLTATCSVRVIVDLGTGSKLPFHQRDYKINIKENSKIGTSLLKLSPNSKEMLLTPFNIIDGNSDNIFQIIGSSADLILAKNLDRELQDSYSLSVVQGGDNSTTLAINITVEDSNDNTPKFSSVRNAISLPEDSPVDQSIIRLEATDNDLPPNSDLQFDILSGNDEGLFKIDAFTGILKIKKPLDFDVGDTEYSLVIGALDGAKPPEPTFLAITTLTIKLEDSNDNAPHFPVVEYLEFVGENEAVGTKIFTARATDLDRGIYGKLNYSIETVITPGYSVVDDSWKLFSVDSTTGLVTSNALFDYEARSRYTFTLLATDSGGRSSKVKVRIEIESRDEFYPQFTERTYRFVVSGSDLPIGYVIGTVVATDRDKGPDGRVVYQLTNQHAYFKVNRTTGAVMIKKKIDNNLNIKQDVSFVIRASSGRQESLTNMTVVEISFDPLAHIDTNLVKAEDGSNNTSMAAATGKVADWAIGLLISLIIVILCFGAVFLFLHVRNRRQKNVNKPGLDSGQNPDNYVDPGAFDTIPVRGGGIPGPASQFGPPKYEDLPTYRNNKSNSSQSGAATTSQISGSDQSGSSGRGSAEDGDDVEDEEIRMINEGIQRENGLHRGSDDNMSDVSVQNTQEYLARLGIVNTEGSSGSRRRTESVGAGSSKDIMLRAGVPIDGLRMFDEDGTAEAEINKIIYSKLTDASDRGSNAEEAGAGVISMGTYPTHKPSMTGSLSSIVHSEEELTGSYNWDYLLDWGPQYQPLAHVFSEIARLKEDAASVKSGTSGTSSGKGKPPLLTSVAPRSLAAPILSGRPPHHPPHPGSKIHLLPRSPINHDSGGVLSGAAPMSPSFSPALSPLATSPSLSPMVTPRHPSSHHVRSQRTTESELRI